MPTLQIIYEGQGAIASLQRSVQRGKDRVSKAVRGAAQDAQAQILARGRANIASAGNFGSRWTQGLRAPITTDQEGDISITVTHDVWYFRVFQEGAVIKGRPLLWIPLSFSDAVGIPPSSYPGRLFSVSRPAGVPLLFSAADRLPKYAGISEVNIPKKFQVVETIQEVARKLGDFYRARFRQAGG